MPRKKSTPVSIPTPTQEQVGELLVSSFEVNSNKTVAQFLENSHDLELTPGQVTKLVEIVKSNSSNSVNAALDQLIQYYK